MTRNAQRMFLKSFVIAATLGLRAAGLLALAWPAACGSDDGVEWLPTGTEEVDPDFNSAHATGVKGYTACPWGSRECNPAAPSVNMRLPVPGAAPIVGDRAPADNFI